MINTHPYTDAQIARWKATVDKRDGQITALRAAAQAMLESRARGKLKGRGLAELVPAGRRLIGLDPWPEADALRAELAKEK